MQLRVACIFLSPWQVEVSDKESICLGLCFEELSLSITNEYRNMNPGVIAKHTFMFTFISI